MFDARTARLLAPGEHLTIAGAPGLRLEATATRRAWIYRYKNASGQMRQVKLGAWPAMSYAAALAAWEEARAVRDAGRDPAAERRAERVQTRARRVVERRGPLTVRRVADLYLDGHVDRHRKAKGAAEVRRMVDTMLGDDGQCDAATYTRRQAFALIERWADAPVQAAKLRRELGAAWDYAIDAGELPEDTPNWWRQIMRGKLRSKGKQIAGEAVGTAKRVLRPAEVGELINWLPNFSQLLDDVLTVYLWTGTRGAEIVAMEAEEITDEATGLWWTVPKHKTKNARHPGAGDLRVPLIGRAERVVRRRLKMYPTGWLFRPVRGVAGHVQQKVITEGVYYRQPYCTFTSPTQPRLTVTHWAPHDLRRTVRTTLASLGCPDSVAEAVLGHMQEGVKGVYNLHQYDNERREWLTRIADYWEQLAASS